MDLREDQIMNPTVLFLVAATWFSDPSGDTTLFFPPFGHCMNIYRAGSEQLALLLGGMVGFDDPQGLACVKLDTWDEPGTGDDDELAVYGVNSGSGHVIYNSSMYALGLYGGEGSGTGELSSPHGIAARPDGTVLVADTGNGRVVVLSREGQRLVQTGLLGSGYTEPWDVAVDAAGSVFVTDRAGGRLYRFESMSDSTPAIVELPSPRGVAATSPGPWTSNHGTFQAVVTDDGRRLVVLTDGEVSASVVPSDCGGSFFGYPEIDYFGNVWVTDSVSCRVHKFTGDLEYLDSWGEPGTEDDQLDHPTGIALWDRFGQIFVAEREGARYFWVGADLRDPDFRLTGTGFVLTAVMTETSNIVARVLDASGDEAVTVWNARAHAGEVEIEWDGTDSRGQGLPAGDYTLEIVFEPTYSSRGYFEKTMSTEFPFQGVATGTGRGN
jgi:DNA-binding beta-propeller fold protein YncE